MSQSTPCAVCAGWARDIGCDVTLLNDTSAAAAANRGSPIISSKKMTRCHCFFILCSFRCAYARHVRHYCAIIMRWHAAAMSENEPIMLIMPPCMNAMPSRISTVSTPIPAKIANKTFHMVELMAIDSPFAQMLTIRIRPTAPAISSSCAGLSLFLSWTLYLPPESSLFLRHHE